jgi:hypothetical protein
MKTGDSQPKAVTRDAPADAATPIKPTAAQRQRAYRRRRRRAAIDAIGEEAAASRVTLLTMLARNLAALETPNLSEHMTQATRSAVQRILNTIVTRYGIQP